MMDGILAAEEMEDSGLEAFLMSEGVMGSLQIWEAKRKHKLGKTILTKKCVTRELRLDGQVSKWSITVYSSHDFGLPSVLDLEFFRGFESISTRQLKNGSEGIITFTGFELLRVIGKQPSGQVYKEMNRFFRKMVSITFGATDESKKKGETLFHIFERVYLPGEVGPDGTVTGHYHVALPHWYWRNLTNGHCLVINYPLFQTLSGSISKLMHQLLHHLFHLGKGKARQRYSEVVKNWGLKRHLNISKIRDQLDKSHLELKDKGLLSGWRYIPIRTVSGLREFDIEWEAGEAWYEADRKLIEYQKEVGGGRRLSVIDPVLIEGGHRQSELPLTKEEKDVANEGVLEDILETVGKRSDVAFVNWWKRAIREMNHATIYRRLSELRERLAHGEKIRNRGGYLINLVKADACRVGLPWALKDQNKQPATLD